MVVTLFQHCNAVWLVPSRLSWERREARGVMGRRKGEGRNDWQILSRKVVRRVEKLCEVVFVIFFAVVVFIMANWPTWRIFFSSVGVTLTFFVNFSTQDLPVVSPFPFPPSHHPSRVSPFSRETTGDESDAVLRKITSLRIVPFNITVRQSVQVFIVTYKSPLVTWPNYF